MLFKSQKDTRTTSVDGFVYFGILTDAKNNLAIWARDKKYRNQNHLTSLAFACAAEQFVSLMWLDLIQQKFNKSSK